MQKSRQGISQFRSAPVWRLVAENPESFRGLVSFVVGQQEYDTLVDEKTKSGVEWFVPDHPSGVVHWLDQSQLEQANSGWHLRVEMERRMLLGG